MDEGEDVEVVRCKDRLHVGQENYKAGRLSAAEGAPENVSCGILADGPGCTDTTATIERVKAGSRDISANMCFGASRTRHVLRGLGQSGTQFGQESQQGRQRGLGCTPHEKRGDG